jgi:hypothetical protein
MTGRCREELTGDNSEEIAKNGKEQIRMGKWRGRNTLAGPYRQGTNNL